MRDPFHGIEAILKTSLLRIIRRRCGHAPTVPSTARLATNDVATRHLHGSSNECFFTMSDNTHASARPRRRIQVLMDERQQPIRARQSFPGEWWSQTGSNRRPHACKARALPTELWPRQGARPGSRRIVDKWWAWDDSNVRPHPYQGCALTT